MTDKQAKEQILLARIDEVDRMMEMLETMTAEEMKEGCRARKKELRADVDTTL